VRQSTWRIGAAMCVYVVDSVDVSACSLSSRVRGLSAITDGWPLGYRGAVDEGRYITRFESGTVCGRRSGRSPRCAPRCWVVGGDGVEAYFTPGRIHGLKAGACRARFKKSPA
jgi:hypothetical protein